MSHAGRQVNARRLPPLPGLSGFNSRHGSSPQSTSLQSSSPTYNTKGQFGSNGKHSDMFITGQPLNSSGSYQSGSGSDRSLTNQESVASFLDANPLFLEQYICSRCTKTQLSEWLEKIPANQKKRTHNEGDQHNSGKIDWHKWKMCHKSERRQVVQEWINTLQQQSGSNNLLYELASCIAAIIEADGFNLYLVKENKKELVLYSPATNGTKPTQLCQKIMKGSTLAAYVASVEESVWTNDIQANENFPKGVGPSENEQKVQFAIAHPVQTTNGETIGVIELFRYSGAKTFTQSNDELYHTMAKQRTLNDFLLTVTKSIFQDIVSMDTVIMKIMNFAKKLVSADRTALFLLDNRTHELYARVFDMGDDCQSSVKGKSNVHIQKEIRFPMDKGVAGHVASTGEVLNIPDAYADERFNRNVDIQTGYKTRTILCMPIYIRGSIIGVVQMVNKLNGVFTSADEQSFQTFSIYCGLALHHAKLYDKIRRSEQKYKVALEVLSYHNQAQDNEVARIDVKDIPTEITGLIEYRFSPWSVIGDDKPKYVIYMFKDLFNLTSNSKEPRFDLANLLKFTLTVRKNYRNVPYHNWAHAFSVAHAMYTVIKSTKNSFNPLERLSLFVACLCHDIDHRGYTNQYMVKTESPLASIYSTSTMEHHHFNHTITILQQDGNNIFKHLTSDEYKAVLGDIKHCILATDLALFFGNKARLQTLVQEEKFDWHLKDHRYVVMAVSMTCCDLCSMYKPWDMQLELVNVIMEEFWQQGDEEKANGVTPTPMMDRAKAEQLPVNQVGFLEGICLPCYELLAKILPESQPMVDGARENLKQWKKLAAESKQKGKEAEMEADMDE